MNEKQSDRYTTLLNDYITVLKEGRFTSDDETNESLSTDFYIFIAKIAKQNKYENANFLELCSSDDAFSEIISNRIKALEKVLGNRDNNVEAIIK